MIRGVRDRLTINNSDVAGSFATLAAQAARKSIFGSLIGALVFLVTLHPHRRFGLHIAAVGQVAVLSPV